MALPLPRRRGLADLQGFGADPSAAMPPGAGEDPTGMGGGLPVGVDTGELGNDDLAGIAGPEGAPVDEAPVEEDQDYAQMEAALNDPNTPPEVRAMLEQQLAMAARRSLSGL